MSYAVCLKIEGYVASLEGRKLYEVVPDDDAKALGMLRGIDESGEDYLYPAGMFAPLQLPEEVEAALKTV